MSWSVVVVSGGRRGRDLVATGGQVDRLQRVATAGQVYWLQRVATTGQITGNFIIYQTLITFLHCFNIDLWILIQVLYSPLWIQIEARRCGLKRADWLDDEVSLL